MSRIALREVVVHAGCPVLPPLHLLLDDARRHEPTVQIFTPAAERALAALVGARTDAVSGHGKRVDAKFGRSHLSIYMRVE